MKVNIGPYLTGKEINAGKNRKVKIKIHPYDAWNANTTLALIIHPVLIELQKNKTGSGHVDDEDVPPEIRSTADLTERQDWQTDAFWHDRSKYIIEEMIFAFDSIVKGTEFEIHDDTGEFVCYRSPGNEHTKRVRNGLRLFGKYYFDLWD